MKRKKRWLDLEDYEWRNEEVTMTFRQIAAVCERHDLTVYRTTEDCDPEVPEGWWLSSRFVGDIEGVYDFAYRLLSCEESGHADEWLAEQE
jgi:hypothetical protein